ncbi:MULTISPECIES: glutaredoxin family protein [Jonquetella]|uniref:Glutaredoxin-like protein, YruB-family n=1 Tax=Jonquetella anthropi DSM 22815 TaxID=885272 RepID=H0ULU1_9BACT|nr:MULTISPECIES: glutaredoxin domain-containing protein [Jonquetella]EEX48148.1 glutaredoxin [Jonquetella anthropi E3_33 E1]EHM13582.1 Glutaredoxin-like protein, YruB-family [Jonquetella anthropi DSM 22815]ERL24437.1 YruB family protein [Jonquetella sp. BV3C21]
MTIKVYSSPTCTWCAKLKDYLTKKGVEFEAIDVSKDRAVIKALVEKTGQMGVPVTEIDGEYIIGFDKAKLDAKLGLK